jgi:hypothetical protein
MSRKEQHPDAVMAGRRQLDLALLRLGGKELVRHLDQNAGPVARVGFAAASAAVFQVFKDLKRLEDDVVRTPAFEIDDKPNTA